MKPFNPAYRKTILSYTIRFIREILPVTPSILLFTGCSDKQLTPPNILWLMTDEQRIDALSFYNREWAKTPNLEKLAREGVIFDRAYTNCPVSMPARISILTGRYPSSHRIWTNINETPFDYNFLTRIFENAGYSTCSVGKQHYGNYKENRAFQDEYSVGIKSGTYDPYWSSEGKDKYDYVQFKGPEAWILGGIFPGPLESTPEYQIVEKSKEWLKNHSPGNPFLLRLSFSAPHTPVTPPVPFDQIIPEESIKLPPEADPMPDGAPDWVKTGLVSNGASQLTPELISKIRRYYYGFNAWVDDQIGGFVAWMEENGYLENTIIVFVSDHGTHLGDFGLVQKGLNYEPSVHVPYFYWYPGKIAHGVRLETPVEIRSLLPTLLDLAGLSVPDDLKDISLAKCLKKGKEPEAEPVFIDNVTYYDIERPADRLITVYNGDWKLTVRMDPEPRQGDLINLIEDPLERNNLYYDPVHQEKRRMLLKLIGKHLEKTEMPYVGDGFLHTKIRLEYSKKVAPENK